MEENDIQASTLLPSIRVDEGEEMYGLKPILIYFSGSLPKHLVNGEIPIRVTVTLAPEHRTFITPVIDTLPETINGSQSNQNSERGDADNSPDIFTSHPPLPSELHHSDTNSGRGNITDHSLDTTYSFLPLPSGFDPQRRHDWLLLCNGIQRWLSSVSNMSQQRSWGREIFWLTFVAINPDFPGGTWTSWNTSIPLEGTFIEGWLCGLLVRAIIEDCTENALAHQLVRKWIWEEFQRQIPLFYPHPLIATCPM